MSEDRQQNLSWSFWLVRGPTFVAAAVAGSTETEPPDGMVLRGTRRAMMVTRTIHHPLGSTQDLLDLLL